MSGVNVTLLYIYTQKPALSRCGYHVEGVSKLRWEVAKESISEAILCMLLGQWEQELSLFNYD